MRPILIGCAIASLTFLALILAETILKVVRVPDVPLQVASAQAVIDDTVPVHVVPLPTSSLEAYRIVIERPVFFENRKFPKPAKPKTPPSRPAPPSPVRQPAKPQLSLSGVMIRGDLKQALVTNGKNVAKWYRRGDVIGGWRLAEVHADKIVLSNRGIRHVVQMFRPAQ